MMTEGKSRAKYQRIADVLRTAIEAGQYGPGDRLPGEKPLAAEHQVAVMTARQALNALRAEGLVTSRRGAGFFVNSLRPIRRRGIQRLSREHWGSGAAIFAADDDRPLTVDRVSVDVTHAPKTIAQVLGLANTDRACARSRRFVLEDKPVLIATSYLPYDLVKDSAIVEANPGPGGIYARLADLGHAPAHFREEVRSRMPSTEEADALGLSMSTPVIKICRTAYSATGRAVEVNDMTLDSASYVLEYEFDA
jgi:GntR family transcriptional regulator